MADQNTAAKVASGSVGDASLRAPGTVAATTGARVAPYGIVGLEIVPPMADQNIAAKVASGSVGDASLRAPGTVAATTGARVLLAPIEAQRSSPD